MAAVSSGVGRSLDGSIRETDFEVRSTLESVDVNGRLLDKASFPVLAGKEENRSKRESSDFLSRALGRDYGIALKDHASGGFRIALVEREVISK